ncbi:hypothetical protein niasHT_023657 [Heterodera trifolii]|uniref:Uncharacterized protein n=1 Tax=Heterodera trifolii TaxID=157864 RepID=A0ABD2JUV3_9BILA
MAARSNEAMVARLIELVQSRQDDLNPPTRTAKANEKQKEAWKFVTDSMNRGGKKFEMTEVSRNVSQLFADSPAFEGVPGGVQTGLNIGDTILFEGKEQEESAEFSSQQVVVEEGKSYAVLGTVPRGEAVKTPKFESSTSRVPFRSRAGTASTVTAADAREIIIPSFYNVANLVAATMPLFSASQTYGKHLKVAKSKELFWNVPTLITAAAVLHNIAIDRNLPDFIDETFVDNQPSLLQINSLPTIRSLDSFHFAQ